jgi:FkbM family methyltransferase
MNNGDDVQYYLLKSPRVVGVEANSALCEQVRRRFSEHVRSGRLIVLNVALSAGGADRRVPFYVHKTNHRLSQLARPPAHLTANFEMVEVESRTPASIVREFGEPAYVKIDLEGFDLAVLKNLFAEGIYPPEISAEAHTADIFAELLANGYAAFNLVDGPTIEKRYGRTTIITADGRVPFAFKAHSAGPFGEDIRTSWQEPDSFFYRLAAAGLGWKDVHASRTITPEPPLTHRQILARQGAALAGKILAGFKRRLFPG